MRLPDAVWEPLASSALVPDRLPAGQVFDLEPLLRTLSEPLGRLSGPEDGDVFELDTPFDGAPHLDESSARQWSISMIVADRAKRWTDLVAYREAYAPEPIARDGIADWLAAQASRTMGNGDPLAFRDVSFTFRNDSGSLGAVLVRSPRDGVLDQLRSLVSRAATRFEWNEADALGFILCHGPIPRVRMVKSQLRYNTDETVLTRIELEVDPALSPNEVAELYRAKRQALMSTRRYREMSLKAAHLAVASLDRDPSESWSLRMQRWNERYADSHPDWVYDDASRFGHDCRESYKRFMQPPFA